MTAPTEGMPAPQFTAATVDGEVSLAELKGQTVVLYFYPKDNTSGCTKEACGFRDVHDDMRALGAVVLGVSKDSLKAHANFTAKHELNFPLLSDPEREVIEAYGAWVEKRNYGRTYFGIERCTYLIDGEGVVRKVWRKVKVKDHVDQVFEAVRELAGS
jgi:thioredoxin-dependent peroxiredoxin